MRVHAYRIAVAAALEFGGRSSSGALCFKAAAVWVCGRVRERGTDMSALDPEHVVFGSARYQSIDGASEAFVRSPMRTCFESSDVQAANRVWTHPGCRQEHCVEETSYKPEVVS